MPTELQFRRDSELNLNGITGLDGEIFVNTDDYSLRVHDGATQGGASTIPTKNYVDIQLNTKLDSSSYNANDVLNKLLTVDGPGSNLNADLLDGQEGSYYLNYSNFTSTPTIGISPARPQSAMPQSRLLLATAFQQVGTSRPTRLPTRRSHSTTLILRHSLR